MRKRAPWEVAIGTGVGVLVLALPTVRNGAAFLYDSSGPFLYDHVAPSLAVTRTAYGLAARLVGGSWDRVIALQCVLTAFLVHSLLRAELPALRPWTRVFLLAACLLATPAGWIAGTIGPDALLPLVVVGIHLGLGAGRRHLEWPLFTLAVALGAAALGVAMHPLGLPLALLTAVPLALLGGRAVNRRRVLGAACAMAVGLAVPLAKGDGAREDFAPLAAAVRLHHLHREGLVEPYLTARCASQSGGSCALRGQIPGSIDAWLWDPTGPLQTTLGGMTAAAPLLNEVSAAAVRAAPWRMLPMVLRNSIGHPPVAAGNDPSPFFQWAGAPLLDDLRTVLASRQQRGAPPSPMTRVHPFIDGGAQTLLILLVALALVARRAVAPPLGAALALACPIVGMLSLLGMARRHNDSLASLGILYVVVVVITLVRRRRLLAHLAARLRGVSTVATPSGVSWGPIALGSVALWLPGLWNRTALVTPDSLAYVNVLVWRVLSPLRAVAYGLFVWLAGAAGSMLGVTAVQAVLVAAVFVTLVEVERPPGVRFWRWIAVPLLAVLTSASWYASLLMPDAGVMLVVPCLYLLVFRGDSLSPWGAWGLTAILALAISWHLSIGPTVAGLLVVSAVLAIVRTGKREAAVRLRLAALAFVLGVGVQPVLGGLLCGDWRFASGGWAPTFGRVVQDGLVQEYLARHCPEVAPVVCRRREVLDRPDFEWVWSLDSPFYELGGFGAADPLMRHILLGSFAENPGGHARSAIHGWSRQLFSIESDVTSWPFKGVPDWARVESTQHFFADVSRSRQNLGYPDLSALRALHRWVGYGAYALLALLSLVLALRRCLARAPLVPLTLTLALVNAFVCGVLTIGYDRYQSRIMGLVVLGAALGLAGSWRVLREGSLAEPERQ